MVHRLLLLTAVLCLGFTGPLWAAVVTLQGSILVVTDDDGSSIFSGTGEGDVFTASFSYPDVPGPVITAPFEARYPLTGAASLSSNLATVSGTLIELIIRNDDPLEEGVAEGINALLNPEPPLVTGQPLDTWTLLGRGTVGGLPGPVVSFEFILADPAAAMFDDLAFRPFPPTASGLLQIFLVRQGSADTPTFQAIGLITEVTAVPLPATAWLLLTGLGLIGAARGRKLFAR